MKVLREEVLYLFRSLLSLHTTNNIQHGQVLGIFA